MLVAGEIDALLSPDLIKPLHRRRQARRPAVPELQAGGDRVLPPDRHLPDHARGRHQAGDRRASSLGGDQHVQGVRRGQGDRHGAHGEPAHRAARLVPGGLGGAGANSRQGPVGVRVGRAQRQELRAAGGLFARAGPDQAAASRSTSCSSTSPRAASATSSGFERARRWRLRVAGARCEGAAGTRPSPPIPPRKR